jgi:DNA-directed RNA polymerase subunit omega
VRVHFFNSVSVEFAMTSHLLEEASKIITCPQVLVNVVSRRVRQLNQGHRPLVETDFRTGFGDIALKEIIEGKLTYELFKENSRED